MVCKGGKRAVGSGEDGKEGNTSLMKERAQERDQVGERRELIICIAKNSVTIIVILRLVHTTLPAMLTF